MIVAEKYRYSSAPERRDRIVQFVGDQGYCTITELSTLFSVSEMTIRRDVARLVEQGKLRGFHGGVGSMAPQVGRDYGERDMTMSEAKHAIAERAATMVESGANIALDAGTTAAHLASFLPRDRGISVVTNSLPAVTVLAQGGGFEVNCLGGVLHPESLSFAGPATLAAVENLQIETLFLAASSLSERGAFCATGFDAITKRALIAVSSKVVLISDSSKYSASAMVRVCGWDAIDVFVTDDSLPHDQRQFLEQGGVDVIIV
jgi:DeoR family transcriptional regulator, aga operon transcriptional repressor